MKSEAAAASITTRPATAPAGPPLEGVRIVDLTVVWSGPYATMFLADLGAEVIRVENPFVLPPTTKGYHPRPILTNPGSLGSLYGPPRPGAPDRPWNRHAMNNSLARNKLSVTIDTRRAEGIELLMRLAEQSDVFIDNFKASSLARIGIEVSELQRRNPRLIIVRLPPAGLNGDWANYTGFGAQFDGLSGLLSVCGHFGSDPTTTPVTTYMDAASGPAGAFAVMAALRYRADTGRGQFVELSQSENVMNHLGDMFVDYQLGVQPVRWGNRDPHYAPQGLYPCKEPGRWIAISVPDDAAWRSLAAVIGKERLAGEGRFADGAARRSHHDELDQLISAWTSTQPVMEAFHLLQSAGIPAGPFLDDELLANDPHLNAAGLVPPAGKRRCGNPPASRAGVHRGGAGLDPGLTHSWRGQRVRLQEASRGIRRGVPAFRGGQDTGDRLSEAGRYSVLTARATGGSAGHSKAERGRAHPSSERSRLVPSTKGKIRVKSAPRSAAAKFSQMAAVTSARAVGPPCSRTSCR